MDSLNSVKQLEFLERSLPFQAFVPFRRVGIMAYDKTEDEMTTLAYSVYRTGAFDGAALGDTRYATDIGDNGGYSFSGRMTHLMYYDEPSDGRYLLHVGGAYNYSSLTGGPLPNSNIYQARVIPEFFVGYPEGTTNAPAGTSGAGTPFFADTGRIHAYGFNLGGLELAGQYGAAHFQAEYMATGVNQIGGPNLFYDGYYIQGGYFLTGESLAYDKTFGVFNGCNPFSEFFSLGRGCGICGWGAWELTGRWSYANLFDPNAIPVPPFQVAALPNSPNPGSLNDLTLGVNWYWNSQTKVQFNYIHAMLNSQFNGNSTADFYAMRFQVAF
jgi:phosphate-selective porin OprO/OprP